jgi:hypothetical protein
MPVYVAGWVLGTTVIKSGVGFTVSRLGLGVAGSYHIVLPLPAGAKFFIPSVTAFGSAATNRRNLVNIVMMKSDGQGSFVIDIEIRDLVSNVLVDSDFTFIAIERSGP